MENQEERPDQNQEMHEARSPEEILKDLQENTVPKDAYNEAVEKYNRLFEDVAAGRYNRIFEPPQISGEEKEKIISKKIQEMKDRKMNGACEYVRTILEVDDHVLAKGQRSIFEPTIDPNEDTRISAEHMHDLLKSALEKSEGSDQVICAIISESLVEPIQNRRR